MLFFIYIQLKMHLPSEITGRILRFTYKFIFYNVLQETHLFNYLSSIRRTNKHYSKYIKYHMIDTDMNNIKIKSYFKYKKYNFLAIFNAPYDSFQVGVFFEKPFAIWDSIYIAKTRDFPIDKLLIAPMGTYTDIFSIIAIKHSIRRNIL